MSKSTDNEEKTESQLSTAALKASLMGWTDKQGHILTGGGSTEKWYRSPRFPFSEQELPHHHLVRRPRCTIVLLYCIDTPMGSGRVVNLLQGKTFRMQHSLGRYVSVTLVSPLLKATTQLSGEAGSSTEIRVVIFKEYCTVAIEGFWHLQCSMKRPKASKCRTCICVLYVSS